MYLKPKLSQIKQAIKNNKDENNFLNYVLVQKLGIYNMLEDKARELTGMTKEEYINIIKSYNKLMIKFPNTIKKASKILEQIKYANIVSIIKQKGCNNCIELTKQKLDITENDLCDSCKNIVTS